MSLVPFADSVWLARAPMKALGLDLGTRMTVIRLPDGGLLLHSPVPLAGGLREEISALGPVRAIVLPNKLHHLYAREALAAWPDAVSFAAPGLAEKVKGLRVDQELGDEPPAAWQGVVDLHLFRAAPSMNEAVLFHRPSGTLLLTDLAFNLQPERPSLWMRVYLKLNGAGRGLTVMRIMRLATRDKSGAAASYAAIRKWPIERVVVCHGEPVASGGDEAVRRAFEAVA